MCSSIFTVFWIVTIGCSSFVTGLEEVIIDTRTATSDVGWVTQQGSEWQEATSLHEDGRERRVLMICQMNKVKQDSWVRSPFIPLQGASRVYIEFEFTMRSCEDVPNVATCKETFNLYYYEADRDEATSTFPPWNDDEYTKVDTIAADKRFHRGSAETNLETRDIGPITKSGIYIALQDSGSCMAIMHLRVYFKYCDSVTQNLAMFGTTVAGPERTSLVEVEGVCVPHAAKEKKYGATLHCNSNGIWAVPKGQCACDPGFAPNTDRTSCEACGRGLYKSSSGNKRCERCPSYSHSRDYGSTLCDCMFGYFRTSSDEPTSPCTKPPGQPNHLQAHVNGTSVTLSWKPPLNDGGRNDVVYRITCEKCDGDFLSCSPCSHALYTPSKDDITGSKVKVQDLVSSTNYKFQVFAENGVSSIASKYGAEAEFASVSITTDYAKPPKIIGLHAKFVETDSVTLAWEVSIFEEDFSYEITISDYYEDKLMTRFNVTNTNSHRIGNLVQDKDYVVQIRAFNQMGYGPLSNPLQIKTLNSAGTSPTDARHDGQDDMTVLVVAAIAGLLLVVLVLFSLCIWRRRNKKHENNLNKDLEKFLVFKSSDALMSNESYPKTHKTYIDPMTYNDPHRAVQDFAKEIDVTSVKIESVIGEGEFGEVCRGLALLPSDDKPRQVAIKTLKSGHSTQQKLDFLSEASIMGQFDHPNVIRLEGVVTKSRPLMIVTEYMENGSLDTYLKNHDNEFSVVQLVGMLRNISAGMKYLSEMGYIHRDLAARNILVNGQLVCKVSDFGMSRVLEDDGNATYTTRGGKIPIRWTAPESITFRKFNSASDVWSFGIVIWEVMSYGERPYWGMSNQDVIQAVDSGYRLPAPMECPLVLHHLMLECWKKNRCHRPKFAEIVTALDRIVTTPAQLKLTAGLNSNNNGRLVPSCDGLLPVPWEEKLLSIPSNSESDVSEKLFVQDLNEVVLLGNWLEQIGLSSYKDNFLQCGFYSLDHIAMLQRNDLCKLGMADAHDQNLLFDNIYALKYASIMAQKRTPMSQTLPTMTLQRTNNLEGVAV